MSCGEDFENGKPSHPGRLHDPLCCGKFICRHIHGACERVKSIKQQLRVMPKVAIPACLQPFLVLSNLMFFTPYGSSLPCFLPHRMLHSMPSHCCITWIMHPYSKSPLPRVNLTRPECRDDCRSCIRAGGKSHCNIVQRSLL